MTSEELALQLRQSQAEATDLRTKVFTLQKDLARTEKRLHKANATATKLEGLLMQTEGEADTLRAQYADASAVAENARRDQQNLLAALDESEKRVEEVKEALVKREGDLMKTVEEKSVTVRELIGKIEETKGEAERMGEELGQVSEKQKEMEEKMREEVERRETIVERMRAEFGKERGSYEGQISLLEEQREQHAGLMRKREERCSTLRERLETTLLTVSNLQLRLTEVKFDGEQEAQQLRVVLVGKENEVLDIRSALTEKKECLHRLEDEKANVQAALVESRCQVEETVRKLEMTEKSLTSLQQQMEQLTAESQLQSEQLQNDLTTKINELSQCRHLLDEQSATHQQHVDELSRHEKEVLAKLDTQSDEIGLLSSRLEASQIALQLLQAQHAQAVAEFNRKESGLETALLEKETLVRELHSTIEACHQEFNKRLLSQAGELTRTMESLKAKDTEVQSFHQRFQEAQTECERLKSQLLTVSEERSQREADLKSQLSQGEAELSDLKAKLESATQEVQRLQLELKSVGDQVHRIETEGRETVSKLRSDLEAAQFVSVTATSEQTQLHEVLVGVEKTVEEQKAMIEGLQGAAVDYAAKKSELEDLIRTLRAEKVGIEKELGSLHEQVSTHEKEKQTFVQELQEILVERDALTEKIEEMAEASSKLVTEAQEDAAAKIAEFQTKSEDLEQQVGAKTKESEIQIQRLQVQLSESKDEAANVRKSLELVSAEHGDEQARLQTALTEKSEQLEKKTNELNILNEEFSDKEAFLNQQLRTRAATVDNQAKAVEQMEAQVSHLQAQVRNLEEKDVKMKAALTSSDSLLARASEENVELMKRLDTWKEEFHKTVTTTSKSLEESQQSEKLSKSAYILLLERLQQLHTLCGFTESLNSDDSDSQNCLHERANFILVQLEEHFRGGSYLEDEVAKLREQVLNEKQTRKELLEEKCELELSLSVMEERVKAKESEIEVVNTQLKDTNACLTTTKEEVRQGMQSLLDVKNEAEKRIVVLEARVVQLEESNHTISNENGKLERICKEIREGLFAKEEEANSLQIREEELRQHTLKHQKLAATASASLEEQERATEITVTSMQRQISETEASLVKMTKNCRDLETKATEVSDVLEAVRAEKDSLMAKVTELSESNECLVEEMKKQQSKAREAVENMGKKLNSSEEALLSSQESSEVALREANKLAQTTRERCSSIEQERDAAHKKIDELLHLLEEANSEKISVQCELEKAHKASLEKENLIEDLEKNLSLLKKKIRAAEDELCEARVEKEEALKSLETSSAEVLNEVKASAAAAEERLVCAQRENDEVRENMVVLSASFDQLKINKGSVESELKAAQEALRETGNINDQLQQNQSKLENNLREAENVISNTRESLLIAEKERDQVWETIAALSASLDDMKVYKSSTESELKALQDALCEKENANARLQQSCNDLRNNLRDAENVSEKAEAELKRVSDQMRSLEAELSSKTSAFETRLQKVSEDLRSQFQEEHERNAEEFKRKFDEASKAEDERLNSMRSELDSRNEEKESLARKCTELSEELSQEKSSASSSLSKLNEKLEAIEASNSYIQEQKGRLETELGTRNGERDELARTCDSLHEQARSKDKEIVRLKERLNTAEGSIKALEDKVKQVSEELCTSGKEHEANMDDMLQRLRLKQGEAEEEARARKDLENESRKRLAEVERLQNTVKKLQQEEAVTKSALEKLEQLLDEKSEEVARIHADLGKENESLYKTCGELERRAMAADETIQVEQTIRKELQAQLDGMRREVELVRKQSAQQENVLRQSEAKTVNAEAEVASLSSRFAEMEAMLDSKAEALAKAERAVEEAQRDGAGQISDVMRQKQEELQRRGEKLALQSKKVGRKLKRVEKMLLAEKKKTSAMLDDVSMVAKRQVSPSSKGISPAMKRVRNVGREPLSPMTTNAKPPLAPMSGTRLKF